MVVIRPPSLRRADRPARHGRARAFDSLCVIINGGFNAAFPVIWRFRIRGKIAVFFHLLTIGRAMAGAGW